MEITNTFEGGLSKDSNILLQPRGTYRDMNNGMLVSYDGNDYVIELPKGTKVTFTIPPIYTEDGLSTQDLPSVIGYISFIDTLVVFSTNANSDGYGEIGQVSFDKDGIGTYVPLYGHVDLNFGKEHQITGFTFEENDKIKRVYWTDNYNEPRVLNVKDPAFNNVPSSQLVNGQEYMVVHMLNPKEMEVVPRVILRFGAQELLCLRIIILFLFENKGGISGLSFL